MKLKKHPKKSYNLLNKRRRFNVKLIRLTHSVTEKSIYVDFGKVEDMIERERDTLIWKGTHAITVKESPKQIANKLSKKTSKEI